MSNDDQVLASLTINGEPQCTLTIVCNGCKEITADVHVDKQRVQIRLDLPDHRPLPTRTRISLSEDSVSLNVSNQCDSEQLPSSIESSEVELKVAENFLGLVHEFSVLEDYEIEKNFNNIFIPIWSRHQAHHWTGGLHYFYNQTK